MREVFKITNLKILTFYKIKFLKITQKKVIYFAQYL